jgi:actin-related protein 4
MPLPGLEIHNPMGADGTVEDWDAATKLWEYAIRSRLITPKERDPIRNGLNDAEEGQEMDVDGAENQEIFLEENPLLMTEPAWNSAKNREKAIEIAIEEWGTPAFWIARTGVLAAFATGKPSALVIDVGARSTSITPVHDGLILKKGSMRTSLAGDFINNQLRLQFAQTKPPIQLNPHYTVISKQPVEAGQPALATYRSFAPDKAPHSSFLRLQEDRILHEFKESVVEVWSKGSKLSATTNGIPNEDLARQEPARPFEFPDGYNQVFGVEQFRAAEGLFDVRAALTSDDSPAPTAEMALPAAIQKSLNSVDIDLRPHLLSNVVLTGASSLVRGFSERLNNELARKIYTHTYIYLSKGFFGFSFLD